jgi:hypothetical protein
MSYLSFRTGVKSQWECYAAFDLIKNMSITTEILDLRNKHFSSVVELLAAIERVHEAAVDKKPSRVFLAREAADLVLTNVAAHAAEALNQSSPIRQARWAALPTRRKLRRFDSSQHQRRLFA